MGRTKKTEVVEEVINAQEVTNEVVKESPVKTPRITITASYKTKTVEGEVIKHRFSGSGATASEAIEDMKGSDEEIVDEYGAKFPSRINLLVNATVKRGDYQFDRAIASQTATDIFINKNVALLNRLFGL